jgi:dolichol-phosphate mannosyltransferase
LTKGPIALVLTAPPLAAYLWLNRDKPRLSLAAWGIYAALVLCLVGPWYAAIIARDLEFARHFFIDQHLARFLYKYHEEPVWYYVVVLLMGCLPWSFLLLPFLRFLFTRSSEVRSLRRQGLGFLLLWAGWGFLFFSVSHSKLPPYVLPVLPALALLIGSYLDAVLFQAPLADFFRNAQTTVPRCAAACLCAVWLVVTIGAFYVHLIGTVATVLQAGLAAGALAGLGLWGRKFPPRAAWLLCGLLGAVMVFEVGHELVPAWSRRRSPHDEISEMVRGGSQEYSPQAGPPNTAVVCYGGEWGSVPFYLGRDDVVFNCDGQTPEEIQGFFHEHPRVVFVARHKDDLETFRRTMVPGLEVVKVVDADEIRVALLRSGPALRGSLSPRPPSGPKQGPSSN